MRRQVICQQCGAVNATAAVVCAACGTRLEHPERHWLNRLRDSEGFRRLCRAPGRIFKALVRHIRVVLTVLAILLVLGGGVICFGLFGSIGWEEFPEPGHLDEEESRVADAFVLSVISGRGGIFRFTPASATVVARRLLNFDPEAEQERLFPSRRPRPKTAKAKPAAEQPESPVPEGGLAEIAEDARKSIRNCRVNMGFVQDGESRYILTIRNRGGDSLPWRVMATFTASSADDGTWRLSGCRLGSWPVSAAFAADLSRDLFREVNPREQLSKALARIRTCRMVLHQGRGWKDSDLGGLENADLSMVSYRGGAQKGSFIVILRPAQ